MSNPFSKLAECDVAIQCSSTWRWKLPHGPVSAGVGRAVCASDVRMSIGEVSGIDSTTKIGYLKIQLIPTDDGPVAGQIPKDPIGNYTSVIAL